MTIGHKPRSMTADEARRENHEKGEYHPKYQMTEVSGWSKFTKNTFANLKLLIHNHQSLTNIQRFYYLNLSLAPWHVP